MLALFLLVGICADPELTLIFLCMPMHETVRNTAAMTQNTIVIYYHACVQMSMCVCYLS